MRAHASVCGFFAAVSSFALCYLGLSIGKAQDILKELEESEHQQHQSQQTHDHSEMNDTKKKDVSKEHRCRFRTNAARPTILQDSRSIPSDSPDFFGGDARCPLLMLWTAPTLRHQKCHRVVA
jgi:hypothetical protein